METTNLPKRIIVCIGEFLIGEIASICIQKFIPISTDNMQIKAIIDNAIIIGTAITILAVFATWIYWYISDLNKKVKYLLVVHKYYEIMLLKTIDSNPHDPRLVYDTDRKAFNRKELVLVEEYLRNQQKLKMFMVGTNKVIGQFNNQKGSL